MSAIGLCDALIITPAAAPSRRVTQATAGVGTMPSETTSRPADVTPATIAASSIVPERRVSRPTMTRPVPIAGVRQHAGSGPPDPKRQFRRQFGIGDAANAVGSEEPLIASTAPVIPGDEVDLHAHEIRRDDEAGDLVALVAFTATGRTISSMAFGSPGNATSRRTAATCASIVVGALHANGLRCSSDADDHDPVGRTE